MIHPRWRVVAIGCQFENGNVAKFTDLILTATSILSLPTSSILRITFFSIFTSWESFLARSGPN
jgi:hypothetical protein